MRCLRCSLHLIWECLYNSGAVCCSSFEYSTTYICEHSRAFPGVLSSVVYGCYGVWSCSWGTFCHRDDTPDGQPQPVFDKDFDNVHVSTRRCQDPGCLCGCLCTGTRWGGCCQHTHIHTHTWNGYVYMQSTYRGTGSRYFRSYGPREKLLKIKGETSTLCPRELKTPNTIKTSNERVRTHRAGAWWQTAREIAFEQSCSIRYVAQPNTKLCQRHYYCSLCVAFVLARWSSSGCGGKAKRSRSSSGNKFPDI